MTVLIAPSIDVANPPEGCRLEASVIAAEIGINLREMAERAGISKTMMGDILLNNVWPVRTDRHEIEAALRDLFRERGASEEQLAVLFHAHIRKRPRDGTDYHIVRARPDRASSSRKPQPPQEPNVLLAKQTLSPEARRHFTIFGANPFDGEVESAEQMFQSGEIRFVREACWQAAIGARFVGVYGESGSGKTTLVADLKERIATDRGNTVVIEPSVVGMEETLARGKPVKSGDILTAMVLKLDPQSPVPISLEKRTQRCEQLLAGSTANGNRHLLLIEEAHGMHEATLRHLKRLHERMRLNGRKPMLGILLVGQPELRSRLLDESGNPRHSLREVAQRIELVELQPLGNDLKGYLAHRAQCAGRSLADFIDDAAIEALRERLTVQRPAVHTKPLSLLYPLAVNNAITACLNRAAALGVPHVTRDLVKSV